jgi:hypothetical protein
MAYITHFQNRNVSRKELKPGVRVHGEKISILRFADGISILVERREDLTRMLRLYENIYEEIKI